MGFGFAFKCSQKPLKVWKGGVISADVYFEWKQKDHLGGGLVQSGGDIGSLDLSNKGIPVDSHCPLYFEMM